MCAENHVVWDNSLIASFLFYERKNWRCWLDFHLSDFSDKRKSRHNATVSWVSCETTPRAVEQWVVGKLAFTIQPFPSLLPSHLSFRV